MLRQIDPRPPILLFPAKLYLDDIKQIIQIFVEAENERSGGLRTDEQVEILFQIQDQTTSDIGDLSGIHPDATNDFLVEARRGVGFTASVRVYKSNTSWYAYGLTDNEHWGLFHKLEALFEPRKLRWKKLLHAHSKVSYWIYGATSGLFIALLPIAFTSLVSRTPVIVLLVILAALLISLRTGLSSHSIVIFRHRADHAVRRQQGAMKAVLEISKLIITFMLGVLTLWLKHKYWP